MANSSAIYSVGNSVAQYLNDAYQTAFPPSMPTNFACQFKLVSSAQIATEDTSALDQMVSIFLHRITVNENFRAVGALQDAPARQPVVFLDLHYLITYWGTSPQAEQTITGWTIQQLQSCPILDASILTADGGWDQNETVQLMMADLSLEDILRIWDALGPKYRLSVAYMARVVRIDRMIVPGPAVVATRFAMQKDMAA
jgi:hypothetical protein